MASDETRLSLLLSLGLRGTLVGGKTVPDATQEISSHLVFVVVCVGVHVVDASITRLSVAVPAELGFDGAIVTIVVFVVILHLFFLFVFAILGGFFEFLIDDFHKVHSALFQHETLLKLFLLLHSPLGAKERIPNVAPNCGFIHVLVAVDVRVLVVHGFRVTVTTSFGIGDNCQDAQSKSELSSNN